MYNIGATYICDTFNDGRGNIRLSIGAKLGVYEIYTIRYHDDEQTKEKQGEENDYDAAIAYAIKVAKVTRYASTAIFKDGKNIYEFSFA